MAKKYHLQPLATLIYPEEFENQEYDHDNAWNYVFGQMPISNALNDHTAGTVVISAPSHFSTDQKFVKTLNGAYGDRRIHMQKEGWREYYSLANKVVNDCWNFRPEILSWCEAFACKNFSHTGKTVGVMLREEFSHEWFDNLPNEDLKAVYSRHPLGPGIKEIANLLDSLKKTWQYDRIFVTSYFGESISYFEQRYGNPLICYTHRKRDTMQNLMQVLSSEKFSQHRFSPDMYRAQIVDYSREILLLSKCDYLITPTCSGGIAALAINGGKYSDVVFLEDEHHIAGY